MNYFKGSTRVRIVWTAGLLAIFLASPAFATFGWGKWDGKGGKSSRKDKDCKDKDKDYCRRDADCKEGYECDDHKCKKDKDFCRVDRDCKDGFYCNGHKCKKDDRNCCKKDSDCKTGELCDDGQCRPDDRCRCDADCQAGEFCGSDGECHTKDIPCDDSDPCTTDVVAGGVCTHTPIDGCVRCTTANDCDDVNVCTTDMCNAGGVCEHLAVDGCVRCASAGDCADEDECTTEECAVDGSCKVTVVPGCGVPQEAAEVCGDCVDNDGNGLADFEDPACCSDPLMTMNMSRAQVSTKGGSSKMSIRTHITRPVLTGVNRLAHDVYVQIRPIGGTDVLCARIPAGSFKQKGRTIRFASGKRPIASAKGISKMVLKLKHHAGGRVLIVGKQMKMGSMHAGPMQVTLGFYNGMMGDGETRCSATVASFRAKKRGLVTP